MCRTHGGEVATTVNYDLPIRYRHAMKASERARIGAAVAQLVPPGSVVGLSGGSRGGERVAQRGPIMDSGRGVDAVDGGLAPS